MRKLSEEKYRLELQRLAAMHETEDCLHREGISYVFGVDEVGRGPLCGPVVAACCVLPESCEILFLNDSKKLSEKRREELFSEIREKALAYGTGVVSPETIDEINILQATFLAMRDAVSACHKMLSEKLPETEGLSPSCFTVLVDGDKKIPALSFPQRTVVKGDGSCASIAAASILAKVTRDRMMYDYDAEYPGYGFGKNKGYGTKEHVGALLSKGPCPIHRKSFLKKILHEE